MADSTLTLEGNDAQPSASPVDPSHDATPSLDKAAINDSAVHALAAVGLDQPKVVSGLLFHLGNCHFPSKMSQTPWICITLLISFISLQAPWQ